MEQIVENVEFLQGRGLFIPRIEAVDSENNIILFKKKGISLTQWLDSHCPRTIIKPQQKKVIARLFLKAARHLGAIHASGFVHGHPHVGNLVVSGNRIGTIDYKSSFRVAENPSKHFPIPNAFEKDYYQFRKIFPILRKRNPELTKFLSLLEAKCLASMVGRYPINSERRNEYISYAARA